MTVGAYFRVMGARFLQMAIFTAASVGYFLWLDLMPMVCVMIGVYLGTMLTHYGIARIQAKSWPVQERLLDWDKVKRMAAEVEV